MAEKPTYQELEKRIQELEQAEEAQQASEAELNACYENAPLVMLLVDRERRVRKMNTAAVSMARRSAEESLGLRGGEALRCVHASDDPNGCGFGPVCDTCGVRNTVLRTFQSQKAFHRVEALIPYDHPDGPVDMHVLVSTAPLKVLGKHRVLVCLEDITGRKKAEEALKRSEQFLNETGRMARVGGWEVDAKTLEVSWTDETYRIHEVPLSEKPPLEETINFFHPDDRPKLKTAIQKALEHGEPYDMTIRFITAKGNHLWTRTICQPHVVKGKTVKLVGTFQDITELKLVEKERERLIGELRKALDEISTLKGILPICTNCKKIRDDKGYWNQIEAYISKYSDVDFSHSICPDCVKKIYPDLDLRVD